MKILLGIAWLLLTDCTSRPPTVAIRDARTRAPAVAIRAVTVVDVLNGSLRGKQTVLVAGNRITTVGSADQVRIPDDADLVDATGGFLIPGLWDMHVHSVANVAVDRSHESRRGPGLALPALPRPRRHWCSQHERRNGRRDARADQVGQAPAGRGGCSRATPIRHRRPFARWRSSSRAATQSSCAQQQRHGPRWNSWSRMASISSRSTKTSPARPTSRSSTRPGAERIPVDGHVPFRVTPEEAADAGQRTAEHPEALAAGCSTAAEAERKRFASVLGRLRQPARQREVPGHVPTRPRALRQPGSGRLRGRHRGVPAERSGGHRSIWSRITTSCMRSRSFRTEPACDSCRRRSAVIGRTWVNSEATRRVPIDPFGRSSRSNWKTSVS